jgi:CRISPR-associated protein Cst1
MLNYTGHPFLDVGIAAMTAYAGKRRPDELTADDLAAVAAYIEANYVRPPLRGHLTMAFTSNAWFAQDAFNPDKPDLSAEQRAARRATRDRWAARHLRQWQAADQTSGEACVFTGLPAAPGELSGKLAPGRAGRAQVPLLQGDDAINFFTGGEPGLPIAPAALLALQFMPLACAKCGVGLLAVHTDDDDLTFEFARGFLGETIQAVTLAQSVGEDKLPGAPRSLRTLLVERLTTIEERRLRTARRSGRAASVTAYNFNNGKSPKLEIYHLPLQITSFLRTALTPAYRDAWQGIVGRGWQRVQVKPGKKGAPAEAAEPKHNYLYEDLFTLPDEAARFVRTYFLRVPRPSRSDDDPRAEYSPRRERDLVSWPLVALFLREVMRMDEQRIERIRLLGDKLAEYTRRQGGRRFFRAFFTERSRSNFMDLLAKTNIAYVKFTNGRDVLFDLDGYVDVFMDGADLLRPDWGLARDLVLIRMVEQLKDWLAENPDALPEDEAQPADAHA